MKKNLLLLFFALLYLPSYACINEFDPEISDAPIIANPTSDYRYWEFKADWTKMSLIKDNKLKKFIESKDWEAYSDYAAILVYEGKFEEAKAIYIEIEKNKANLYTTASNLGTIYELIGKPDSALYWIKRSMVLNPQSHGGSEWIHVKILEHKLSKKVLNGSVLGLDFGTAAMPNWDINKTEFSLTELEEHISHQLQERCFFVKPQNDIVGSLYCDLGHVLLAMNNPEDAILCYKAAIIYGHKDALMDKRIAKVKELFAAKEKAAAESKAKQKAAKQQQNIILFSVGIGLLILVAFIVRTVLLKQSAKEK